MLQKGTELGISQFVPVISERSIVRPAAAIEKKYDRWRKIIQEAAEQCGRGRIPSLGAPLAYGDAISRARGLKILPWEHALAAPEDADWSAQRLETVLSAHQNSNEPVTNLSLLIGPEGGISTAEATAAQAYDWQLTSLGSRILRAETAAIATTAIIMHQLG